VGRWRWILGADSAIGVGNRPHSAMERETTGGRAPPFSAPSTLCHYNMSAVSAMCTAELPSDLLQQSSYKLLLLLWLPEGVALDLLQAEGDVRIHRMITRQRLGHHLIQRQLLPLCSKVVRLKA
jgi:hypothetical protein